ncbi:type II toxin-antitoxin system RelB/DinJ family antitoxin [Taylorella asinigenitalis]|uniref:type II toxin-antitoxin system RelB/DinJ family antitoxin n=1 Tax=Taylorella asinigenitalis TaxID=84590 RepID=UPI0011E5CC8C
MRPFFFVIYGLTVPQAFKLFANQVVRTRVVPLEINCLPTRATTLIIQNNNFFRNS